VNKGADLEIVLPVYNESRLLARNTLRVKSFLEEKGFKFTISIVDNGSEDDTFKIARDLERNLTDVSAFKLKEKGRGRALKSRILNSTSTFLGYMDIDLSVELADFLTIHSELKKGADVVISSRLMPLSSVKRSFTRECLSRGYSKMVRSFLNLPFLDYQCGLKLFNRERIMALMPLVKNNNWFFDTELIFYAYKKGLSVKEVPVAWNERKKGTVKLLPTIIEDIKGLVSLRFSNSA